MHGTAGSYLFAGFCRTSGWRWSADANLSCERDASKTHIQETTVVSTGGRLEELRSGVSW